MHRPPTTLWHHDPMTLHALMNDSSRDDQAINPLEVVPLEPRSHADGRPWLFTNMVASLDGAAAVDGLSGALGDNDDKAMFRALRASADAILVGAGTANAEGYRPPILTPEVISTRATSGRNERPIIAVVSASLSLHPDLDLFTDPTYRPIIFTAERSSKDQRSALAANAEIVVLGQDRVDLRSALTHLGEAGHRTVLSEGGPTLNGQLIDAGLIDEWNLTLAPLLVGGNAPRPAHGPGRASSGSEADHLPDYELARLWRGDRAIFSRWVTPG